MDKNRKEIVFWDTSTTQMKIILHNRYKSLHPFTSEELAPLTIITGKNGSGKSQLLTLIHQKLQRDSQVSDINLELVPAISKVHFGGLATSQNVSMDRQVWKLTLDRLLQPFMRLTETQKQLIDVILEEEFELRKYQLNALTETFISDTPKYKDILRSRLYETQHRTSLNYDAPVTIQEQTLLLSQLRNDPEIMALLGLLKEARNFTNKNVAELSLYELQHAPYTERLIDTPELFRSRTEMIFYNYAIRRSDNLFAFFEKTTLGETNGAIPDEEFLKKYPAPWTIFNDILAQNQLNFYFDTPPRKFNIDTAFPLILRSRKNEQLLTFADLSTGESLMVGLIQKLFTSEYYQNELAFPELLILDEPDAPLHPEMCKLFIDIIAKTFVEQLKIKVIFSTHSPSTVALAPEEALFELSNHERTALRKITKDEALRRLTAFIPTLSINYKNHRQIFVESPLDGIYYRALYDRHNQAKPMPYKLYFMEGRMGEGNCQTVQTIVGQLRAAGVESCFGIIDWDKTNKESAEVRVHGAARRYSLENFRFDPVYLAILLCQRDAYNMRTKTGIGKRESEHEIMQRSADELQKISEVIFADLALKVRGKTLNEEPTELKYWDGRSIWVPTWFVQEQGHWLEEKIKETYPMLNEGKYTSRGILEDELATIMTRCYPFVPTDSITLLEGLAGIKTD